MVVNRGEWFTAATRDYSQKMDVLSVPPLLPNQPPASPEGTPVAAEREREGENMSHSSIMQISYSSDIVRHLSDWLFQ